MSTIDKEKAQTSPTSVFKKPADVLKNKDLDKNQKAKVLQEWELDTRLSEVATEEGMQKKKPASQEPATLSEVKKAQHDLGEGSIEDAGAPTKFSP